MHLATPEAEHLDRGKLALSLGDVRVGQREHHGEGQRRGHHGHDVHHHIDDLEALREVIGDLRRAVHVHERGARRQTIGQLDLLLICAREIGQQRIRDARLAEGLGISALGHEHEVAQEAHGNAIHAHRPLAQRRVLQEELVAEREAEHLLGILGHEDAVAVAWQRKLLSAHRGGEEGRIRAILGLHVRGQIGVVGNHDELNALPRAPEFGGHTVDARLEHGVDHARLAQLALTLCEILVGGNGQQVVANHTGRPVLTRFERDHGIANAQAADHEGGAARDTEHRHEETLLVAEQVAGTHLVEEGQPAPHRGDALQQDALARTRGLGAHKRGRRLLKHMTAGQERGAHDTERE